MKNLPLPALLAIATVAVPLTLNTPPAVAKCAADDLDCTLESAPAEVRERIQEGLKEIQESDDLADKAEAIKEMLHDCVECTTEALTGGLGKFGQDETE